MKSKRYPMCKYVLLLAVLICSKNGIAQDSLATLTFKVQSSHVFLDTVSEKIRVAYCIKANDTVDLDSVQLTLQYPTLANTRGFLQELAFLNTSWSKPYFNTTLITGDSISDTAELFFNKDRMPFYFQYLELNMRSLNDTAQRIFQSAEVMVYFTPYDTIEVYNSTDFDRLHRIWNTDDSQMVALRIPANKNELPVSNLSEEDFANDSLVISYYSHPALSYVVPKQYAQDTFDLQQESEEGVSRRADACGNNKRRWKGTFTGSLNSRVELDRENTNVKDEVNIKLRKIRVRIMEKDAAPNPDDELAVIYTDDEGNFSRYIETCQRYQGGINAWNEGDALEIYYIIEGANSSRSVIARTDLGATRRGTWHQSSPEIWNYNNGNVANHAAGEIWPDNRNVQAQLVHWASLCRDFVKSSDGMGSSYWLGDSYHPVVIKYLENFDWSFYYPDKLRISHLARNDENTVMHEFGHYFLYHAQGKSWPHHALWGDHGIEYNAKTRELAWTEGFATAFGLMVDMYYHNLDGEGGLEPQNHETRQRFEFNTPRVLRHNVPGEERVFTHGLVTEYTVSCFLLDLFDNGSTRRTMRTAAAITSDDGNNIGSADGWDNISLPFSTIIQPILDHQGSCCFSYDVLQNVEDYVFALAKVVPCNLRSEIWPCVFLNGLRNFSDPVTQWIGSDWVRVQNTMEWDQFKFKNGRDAFKFKGHESESYWQDVQLLTGTDDNFNLCTESNIGGIVSEEGFISDPLTIENGAVLGFNVQEMHDFYNQTGFHMPAPPVTNTFTAYISNRNTIVAAGGIMEFGDANGTTVTNAEVCAGTRITLGQTNMGLDPAKMIINDNSKLTINEGAELVISKNYQIILNGPNAILEIKGTVIIKDGATFTVSGGDDGFGFVRTVKDYPPASPAFKAHNNVPCRIELTGNDPTDKLLEIRGTDGLYLSLPGIVWLENCKVEMETGSKFNPEIDGGVVIKNSDFAAYNTTPGHRGILIPGYTRSYFNHVNISDGQKGVQLYRSAKNSSHLMSYTNFDNCDIGIESLGVDFYYDQGTISNYGNLGANLLLLGGHTRFNGINISKSSASASSTAIYHTSAGGSFSLLKCVLNNNNIGMETWDGKVLTSCNQISNCNDLGFKSEVTAAIDMSTIGNNLLENNSNHILNRYDGYWTVKGGKNLFINSGSTTAKFWVSMGYNPPFVNPATHSFNADQNYFHASGSSPWTISGSSLLEAKILNNLTVINHDNNAGNIGTWTTNRENYCNLSPGSGGPSEKTIVTTYPNDRYGSFSHNITTTLFGTGELTEALQIVSDSVNGTDQPNYNYAINAYCQILNAYYVDTPSYAVQGTLRDAFSDKMTTFQHAMSNWNDSVNYNYDTLCTKMLGCNSALITKAGAGKFPWTLMKYELYRDRSTIYRYMNNYGAVYSSIDSGKSKISDAGEIAYFDYLKCRYEGEKAMLDSLVSPDSLLYYYPCVPESLEPLPMPLNKQRIMTKNSSDHFVIQPNPSDDIFEIKGKHLSKIVIYNSTGKEVYNYSPAEKLYTSHFISSRNLPVGVYSVEITSFLNTTEYYRIMVQR
ncbi:MAG: hypothetical protein JNL57_06485 [Bacteroidetes bacterium]|nr:hypothetical protein [Bacteroidota bacterium]